MGEATDSRYQSVQIAADGSIFAAGECVDASNAYSFCVSKFRPNGIPDSTFGKNGQASVGYYSAFFSQIALQDDGRVLLAGSAFTRSYTRDGLVVRLNTDGSVDESFADKGFYIFDNGGTEEFFDMKILGDKTICAAGLADLGAVVACVNPDGSPQTNFANAGKLELGDGNEITSFAVDDSDNLYLFRYKIQADTSLKIHKVNSAGAPDTGFDGDGVLEISEAGVDLFAGILQLQNDGKIILAGYEDSEIILIRLNADGSVDPSFSGDGKTKLNLGAPARPEDMVLDSDGRIYIATNIPDGDSFGEMSVVRMLTDGNLDLSFNGTGVKSYDIAGPAGTQAFGIVLRDGGKILIAGGVYADLNKSFLWQLNSDGSVDSGVFSSGSYIEILGNNSDEALAVQKTSDGSLVVLGDLIDAEGNVKTYVSKISATGSYDSSFGTEGTAIIPVHKFPAAFKVLSDDRIAILLEDEIYMLTPKGALDTSFAGDGSLTVDLGLGDHILRALTELPDKKILAVGSGYDVDDRVIAVRILPDGTFDATFDSDGKWMYDFGVGNDVAYAVEITSSGDYLIAGELSQGGARDLFVACLKADGSFNTSFASAGFFTSDPTGSEELFRGLRVDSQGRPLVLGRRLSYPNDTIILRLTPAGTLDSSFDGDGLKTLLATAGAVQAENLLLQDDGKILIGGKALNVATDEMEPALVRLNTDGSIDTTYGVSGTAVLPIVKNELYTDSAIYSLTQGSNGEVYVAGHLDWHMGADSFIARIGKDGFFGPL
ncbi:hypothetical protein EZJ49_10605 [Bdellovibrio bacteriovorus]|uniref:hypothetical protein n=1 Tax=Bdellovibrio bacteriovorus TaxID=959 RepID=UPI0021CE1A4C|nr:hypothetical protein [Bdellovibrio bacteriovorus]UXR63525.1 hypothetical protein EZJ49_10605 [Bdellovibrio bacteriovorus]